MDLVVVETPEEDEWINKRLLDTGLFGVGSLIKGMWIGLRGGARIILLHHVYYYHNHKIITMIIIIIMTIGHHHHRILQRLEPTLRNTSGSMT